MICSPIGSSNSRTPLGAGRFGPQNYYITDYMSTAVDWMAEWSKFVLEKLSTDPIWMIGAVLIVGFFVVLMILKKRVSD